MVDILLATYNGEQFIAEQIESVLKQTNASWRLLVSDDGSTDNTLAIVHRYAETDDRIRVVSGNNGHGGPNGNFMFLLRQSHADYAMFCDQDDVWYPQKVELTLDCMASLESRHPNRPALVFTDHEVVDENLETIHESFWQCSFIDPNRTEFSKLLVSPVASGCTMMVNDKLRELVLRTPPTQEMILYDWWISLVASGFGVMDYVNAPTSKYRQHGTNAAGAVQKTNIQTLATWRTAAAGMKSHIMQAESFYQVYGDQLNPSTREQLTSFIGLKRAGHLSRLPLLIRSGAWKRGHLRQVGEIVLVLFMNADDANT